MTMDELMVRRRDISDRLCALDDFAQERELTPEETKEYAALEREMKRNIEDAQTLNQEAQAQALVARQEPDCNAELREFLRNAQPGKTFSIPMHKRAAVSYGSGVSGGLTHGTNEFVQGVDVVDLISTDRPDEDILTAAGVPMTLGVTGNKIQWAFAGGVEAVFANELAATTERTVDLDAQTPIQQRLTVRVRISQQALENTDFDLLGYVIKVVQDSIRHKINFAAASTTKATNTFYGGFAQSAESGTYGGANYVAGKQAGTYTTFSKDTAAEMIGKLSARNIKLTNTVFVMGGEDFWALKVTPFDAGSGIMLIGDDNRLLGIPVLVNNAINRATEKGAISGHNIGLGNFSALPVMQHGNIRLSVDAGSATAASTDEVIVTINADFSMTVLKSLADAFVVYSKSAGTGN